MLLSGGGDRETYQLEIWKPHIPICPLLGTKSCILDFYLFSNTFTLSSAAVALLAGCCVWLHGSGTGEGIYILRGHRYPAFLEWHGQNLSSVATTTPAIAAVAASQAAVAAAEIAEEARKVHFSCPFLNLFLLVSCSLTDLYTFSLDVSKVKQNTDIIASNMVLSYEHWAWYMLASMQHSRYRSVFPS